MWPGLQYNVSWHEHTHHTNCKGLRDNLVLESAEEKDGDMLDTWYHLLTCPELVA